MLWLALHNLARAGEYVLSNGNTLRGEAASMNEDGLVVRLAIGGFSERVAWGLLTQETLKELAKNPQAKDFVEPFIEIPASERIKRKEITIKPVTRIERPEKPKGVIAAFTAGSGLLLLLVLYAANLYAAFEVAAFRMRPAALVCGVAAVFPVIGPILFALIPAGHAAPAPAHEAAEEAAGQDSSPLANAPAAMAGHGLAIAGGGGKPAAPTGPDTTLYTRGDSTFNRRFFETKYVGFFRVVPSEAEKDYILSIKTAKNEFAARRISRISSNELHLQLLKGATEVAVTFTDILQCQVRHKDARA